MLTDAQRKERINYIGGSDASSIMGVSPYKTRVQLYLEKIGYNEQEDISHLAHIEAGNRLEPALRRWFQYVTGWETIEEPDTIHHPEHHWMAANIDGWVLRSDGTRELLEIKTSRTDKGWGKDGDNTTIPDVYLCQVAHYCIVTDVKRCHIAVLISGSDFRIYIYERNPALENKILSGEEDFWLENVQKGIAPEPQTAKDILSLYGTMTEQDPKVINDDTFYAVENYKLAKIMNKKSEETMESTKNYICSYMGKHDTLIDSSGKKILTWKPRKGAETIDRKRLEQDYPEIVKSYVKIGEATRTFKVEM